MPTQTPISQRVPRKDAAGIEWTPPNTVAALEAELGPQPNQADDTHAYVDTLTLWALSQPAIHMPMILPHTSKTPGPEIVAQLWEIPALSAYAPHYWISAYTSKASTQQGQEVRPSVDEFIAWLDSEDFGDDAERIRREAWGRDQ